MLKKEREPQKNDKKEKRDRDFNKDAGYTLLLKSYVLTTIVSLANAKRCGGG